MFKKIKLWLARRELHNAARHEAELRDSWNHMRHTVLPALEKQVERCELDVFLDGYGT